MSAVADAPRSTLRATDVLLVLAAVALLVAAPIVDVVEEGSVWVGRWIVTEVLFYASYGLVLAGGAVALRRRPQQGNGRIMLWIFIAEIGWSIAYTLGRIGPLAVLADVTTHASDVLFGWLLLRWPLGHLQTRAQRVAFGTAATLPFLLRILADLTYSPAADHWTWPTWWPTVLPDQPLAVGLFFVEKVVWGSLLAVFAALVALRFARASRPQRRELAPVGAAVVLALTAQSMTLGTQLKLWPDLDALVFYNLATASIPVGLLLSVAVRRVQRALAVENLATHGHDAEAGQLVRILRRALGDPQLEVATFSMEAGAYVDQDGHPAAEVHAGRSPAFVAARDGSPLARLDLDRRLEDRADLTEPVIRTASVALETVRLRADLATRSADEERVRAELATATEESAALSRLLPTGLPEKLRSDPGALGRIDQLDVTVLMSDVRGYSGVAERTDPKRLALQLRQHRTAMNDAVLAEGGTIMQYVGDAVMAVFGAPFELRDHADHALRAAERMHRAQAEVNARWAREGLEPFLLGIGVSTGPVATALLGSDDRFEYTIVGDTVNLAQRLESNARPGGTTIASAATIERAGSPAGYVRLDPLQVKGREALASAYAWVVPEPEERSLLAHVLT